MRKELDSVEDASYFFKTQGAVKVSDAFPSTGFNRLLAVSSHTGVLFWARGSDVWWAHTCDAVDSARNSNNVDMELGSSLPSAMTSNVTLLSISPEEEYLGVCYEDKTLSFWSLEAILKGLKRGENPPEAFRTIMDGEVRALLWSENKFFCFLQTGAVYDGSVGEIERDPCITGCNAFGICQWRDGLAASLKDSQDSLFIKRGTQEATIRLTHDDEGQLEIETIHWLDEQRILVGCSIHVNGDEDDVAYLQLVTIKDAVVEHANLEVYLVDIMTVEGSSFGPNLGPYLQFCNVQDWNVTVLAHSKSVDMHFRLMWGSLETSALPVVLDVAEEGGIKVPMSDNDDDNYVVGIGMDFTSENVPVEWKVGDGIQKLKPCPVLVAATTDGHLRFYSFGQLGHPYSLVHPPRLELDSSESCNQDDEQRDYDSLPDAVRFTSASPPPEQQEDEQEKLDSLVEAIKFTSGSPKAEQREDEQRDRVFHTPPMRFTSVGPPGDQHEDEQRDCGPVSDVIRTNSGSTSGEKQKIGEMANMEASMGTSLSSDQKTSETKDMGSGSEKVESASGSGSVHADALNPWAQGSVFHTQGSGSGAMTPVKFGQGFTLGGKEQPQFGGWEPNFAMSSSFQAPVTGQTIDRVHPKPPFFIGDRSTGREESGETSTVEAVKPNFYSFGQNDQDTTGDHQNTRDSSLFGKHSSVEGGHGASPALGGPNPNQFVGNTIKQERTPSRSAGFQLAPSADISSQGPSESGKQVESHHSPPPGHLLPNSSSPQQRQTEFTIPSPETSRQSQDADDRAYERSPSSQSTPPRNLNVSMNDNPVYDISSLNSSAVRSMSPQLFRPQAAPQPQKLSGQPQYPPGLEPPPKLAVNLPPGLLKKGQSSTPGLYAHGGKPPMVIEFKDGVIGSKSTAPTADTANQPATASSSAYSAQHPKSFKNGTSMKPPHKCKSFDERMMDSHRKELEWSQAKVADQEAQAKRVRDMSMHISDLRARSGVIREKLGVVKEKRSRQELGEEIKSRVQKVLDTYRRVNAGVKTFSRLQAFYHGNMPGQSSYYAVTESMQGIRTVANDLQSRIRKIEEHLRGREKALRKSDPGMYNVSGQIELSTAWSRMMPDVRKRIAQQIRGRETVIAYAPGVIPRQQPEPQRPVDSAVVPTPEQPPPLPSAEIHIPGVPIKNMLKFSDDAVVEKTEEKMSSILPEPGTLRAEETPPEVNDIPPAAREISLAAQETPPEVKETSVKAKETSLEAKFASLGTEEASLEAKVSVLKGSSTLSAGESVPKFPSSSFVASSTPFASASFGSPTSIGEIFSKSLDDNSTSAQQEALSQPLSMSSGLPGISTPVPSTEQVTSVLGSPKMTIPDPPPSILPTSQPLEKKPAADKLQTMQKSSLPFGDPSPFASGVPEGASDILPPGVQVPTGASFAGLGSADKSDPSSPVTTPIFPAASQPSPSGIFGSGSPYSPFSPSGAPSGFSGQQAPLNTGGVFGGFGQQSPVQGGWLSGSNLSGSGQPFAASPPHHNPNPTGAAQFGMLQSPSQASPIGATFGSQGVLGAGGVANSLGSLQTNPGGGYAGMSGGDSAFSKMAAQGGGGIFGSSTTASNSGGGSAFSNFASGGSVFGKLGATGSNVFGRPPIGDGMPGAGDKDSQLWKPRR